MWHLVHANRVRNVCHRRPKTRRMCSPKVALLKIPMDSVQYNTRHCGMITRMMSTAFMCSRNRPSSRSPLCWFNEYVYVRVVVLQYSAYRNFQKCKFCLFRAFYRCHFLHDFHTWGVTFKGKFWQKMYISDLFTVGFIFAQGWFLKPPRN